MAGLAPGTPFEAAGMPFVMYDRNPYYGGHTHSLRYDTGFVFDEGGHVSFTKHRHVRDILAENVKGDSRSAGSARTTTGRGCAFLTPSSATWPSCRPT